MNTLKPIFFVAFLAVGSMVMHSCDEGSVKSGKDIKTVEIDSSKSSLINVSGKLFSIPSPIQTALLIKDSEAGYKKGALSDPKKYKNYSLRHDKALNFGVYGTDMAYTSLFDDGQSSLQYFKALDNLADELEIKGAIDSKLIKQLGSNVGNADSLLYLSGKFYSEADAYLKENERYDVAALILAGGWVESSHLTALSALEGNSSARTRLAAQKKPIGTIVEVLKSLEDESLRKHMVVLQLDSIYSAYQAVESTYTYAEPITNPDTKTTVITGQSSYTMSDSLLTDISNRIKRVRAEIIQ